MAHDALFADAARPKRVTILGLRMLDYTLGHELVLWQRRNPLVTLEPLAFFSLELGEQAAALARVAMLCCEKTPRWLRLWEHRAARMDIPGEVMAFCDYRASGSLDLPLSAMPKTPGVPYHYFGAPELARLINYVSEKHGALIAAHFGGSPFNFPFGLARILYTTAMECEGSLWVKNQQDEELERRAEAYNRLNPHSGFAVGDDAVRELARKWNREHPEAQVPVPGEN